MPFSPIIKGNLGISIDFNLAIYNSVVKGNLGLIFDFESLAGFRVLDNYGIDQNWGVVTIDSDGEIIQIDGNDAIDINGDLWYLFPKSLVDVDKDVVITFESRDNQTVTLFDDIIVNQFQDFISLDGIGFVFVPEILDTDYKLSIVKHIFEIQTPNLIDTKGSFGVWTGILATTSDNLNSRLQWSRAANNSISNYWNSQHGDRPVYLVDTQYYNGGATILFKIIYKISSLVIPAQTLVTISEPITELYSEELCHNNIADLFYRLNNTPISSLDESLKRYYKPSGNIIRVDITPNATSRGQVYYAWHNGNTDRIIEKVIIKYRDAIRVTDSFGSPIQNFTLEAITDNSNPLNPVIDYTRNAEVVPVGALLLGDNQDTLSQSQGRGVQDTANCNANNCTVCDVTKGATITHFRISNYGNDENGNPLPAVTIPIPALLVTTINRDFYVLVIDLPACVDEDGKRLRLAETGRLLTIDNYYSLVDSVLRKKQDFDFSSIIKADEIGQIKKIKTNLSAWRKQFIQDTTLELISQDIENGIVNWSELNTKWNIDRGDKQLGSFNGLRDRLFEKYGNIIQWEK